MDSFPKTVLVADDNPATAHVIQFNLERAGFQVRVAPNGQAAWDSLHADCPDLLICDHQMPLLSGVDLCRRIRADRRLEGLPIILLTAKRMELDMEHLRQDLHLAGSFAKPFSPSQLVATVAEILTPVSAS